MIDTPLRDIFIQAEKVANSGHYLQRRIGLANVFQLPQRYIDLLLAFNAFLTDSEKPHGLDEFLAQVDSLIAHHASEIKATPSEWKAIQWGIEIDVLNQYGVKRT